MTKTQERLRSEIGERVRRLRQDRRWTQSGLAEKLGLSQNRLSEVEHGKGSFTAEQFITILKLFNVPVETLAPIERPAGDEVQNALARLGATHLGESTDVLPTERLREALAVIPEALVSGDPRLLAAIAPVLVNHTGSLSLAKLHADAAGLGLLDRLGWVVENVDEAIGLALRDEKLPVPARLRYRKALLKLDQYLHGASPARPSGKGEDVLDPGATNEEALKELRKERSEISRRWHVVTRIQPEDFKKALEAARDLD